MSNSQLLDDAGDEIEVTWTVEKLVTRPSGTVIWILKEKICNKSTRSFHIAVAENPWLKSDPSKKVDYTTDEHGEMVAGSDDEYAKQHAKKLDLKTGECSTVEFNYDVELFMADTQIYTVDSNGKLSDKPKWQTVQKL